MDDGDGAFGCCKRDRQPASRRPVPTGFTTGSSDGTHGSTSKMNKCSPVSSLTGRSLLAKIKPSSADCRALYLVDALALFGLLVLKKILNFGLAVSLAPARQLDSSRFAFSRSSLGWVSIALCRRGRHSNADLESHSYQSGKRSLQFATGRIFAPTKA